MNTSEKLRNMQFSVGDSLVWYAIKRISTFILGFTDVYSGRYKISLAVIVCDLFGDYVKVYH